MRCSINVDHIARIEGHGNIHLAIEDGAVATCDERRGAGAPVRKHGARPHVFRDTLYRLAHLRHLLGKPCGHRSFGHRARLRHRGERPHACPARALDLRVILAEPRDAPVRVRRARLHGAYERFPAGHRGTRAVQPGACLEGIGQRAVHEGWRALRAPDHGGRGRLHERDLAR